MEIPVINVIKIHEVLVPTPASIRHDWLCFSKVPIKGIHVLCYYPGLANMSGPEWEHTKKFSYPNATVIINCPTFEFGQQISVTLSLIDEHPVYSTHGAICDDRIAHKINKLIYEAFNLAGIS